MTTPAAGWYHDPSDSRAWRWWDGETWTAHVRPVEETAPVAVQPVAVAPVITESVLPPQRVEPPQQAEPSEQPMQPQPVQAPQPVQTVTLTPATPPSDQIYWHSAEAEVVHIPGRSATSQHSGSRPGGLVRPMRTWGEVGSPQTAGIWLLASLPLLSIAATVVLSVVFGVFGVLGATQGATGVLLNMANVVFSVILILSNWVFAGLDIKALRQRGYEPPSIAWMLLLPPLAYFIRRGKVVRREGKRAWPPELLYFLSVIGIIGLWVAFVVLTITMMGGIDGLAAPAGAVSL